MAADIAQLSITIDASGATRQVNALGSSLDNLASKGRKATDAERQLALAHEYAAQAAFADRFQTDAHARSMALAEIQAYKLAESQTTAGAAAGIHGLQLGRLNMELGTAIGRFAGVNTAATRLAGQLGGAAAGYGPMIAVLATITAGIAVYKAWHEEATKAKDEQDKLNTSLLKWYDQQKQGPAGEFPKQIEAMTTKIKELRKELDGLADSSFFKSVTSAAGVVGQGGSKLSAWLRIFTAGDASAVINQFTVEVAKGAKAASDAITKGGKAIIAAGDEAAKDIEKAAKDKRAKALDNEIGLFSAGLAGPEAVAQMQAQIAQYKALAAQFASVGDVAHALEYAGAAKKLTDALNPLVVAEKKLADAARAHTLGVMREEAIEFSTAKDAVEANTQAINDNVVAMQKQLKARFDQQSQSAKQYYAAETAAVKKFAQEAEHILTSAFSTFFSDLLNNGKDAFSSLWDAAKQGFIKLLADMAALKLTERVLGTAAGAAASAANPLAAAATGNPFAIGLALFATAGSLFISAASRQDDSAEQQYQAAQALKAAAKGLQDSQESARQGVASYLAPPDDLAQKIAQENQQYYDVTAAYIKAVGFTLGDVTLQMLKDANAAKIAALQAADAQKRVRSEEDAQARLLAATGADGGYARALTERREIEDLVASGASKATIELTKLAQAAEDAASAAAKAAAQQSALQDLNVELLNAQGKNGEAADLQFQLDQQRRLEDAQKNQSTDYVSKLLELQQIQRDQRAAQQLIDSTGGGSGSPTGAASALKAVSAVVTDRSALMLVDIDRAQLTTLNKIEVNTRGGGAGGSGITVNLHNTFSHKIELADVQDIIGEMADEINKELGGKLNLQSRFAGSVGR